MIGNRPLQILRATEGARDAEGRRTAISHQVVATVTGNLFDRTMTYFDTDGQLLNVFDATALLPAGTDLQPRDLLRGADGVTWRVQTVTLRRNHLGQVHHVSAKCVREDNNDE